MNQNDQGAPDAPQFQRISSSRLGVMLLLLLPLFISFPLMAGNDVPVDPAIILPPDPVWPEPPAPPISTPAPDNLSVMPALDPMAVSGGLLSAQPGVPATP